MSKGWIARFALSFLVATVVPLSFVGASSQQAEGEAVEQDFTPPQIILSTQKQPAYPPAAFDARYSGSVLVEMTVQEDGSVGDVKVVECTRPKVGFEEAAMEAVKKWRFEPGMKAGAPIAVATRLKLNFTRVGVGLTAQPQVSAGSFSVASAEMGSTDQPSSTSSNRSSSASSSGSVPK